LRGKQLQGSGIRDQGSEAEDGGLKLPASTAIGPALALASFSGLVLTVDDREASVEEGN
jgi:hypothetical protein